MKEKNNIKKYIVYFIIAFISFISISAIATILDKIYSIKKFNIIYVFLFIFNCIYTKKYIKFNNYLTNKILFSIYGFIFCIFYFMGLVLNNDLLLSKKIILLIILASLGTYMPISFFVINADIKLKQVLISNKKNEKLTSIKKCLIGIIIFLSWFLVFLAYYPGLFNYDVVNQLEQGYGNYSTHHPLIHTLLINFFYNLSDNRNLGIVLYTIIQMSILALAFTYEMIFLYKININKRFWWICLFWIAITPFFSVLSISITKDIYFTAFFIIFMVDICYIVYDKNYLENDWILNSLFISIIFVGLFRNNGIYFILITCPIIALKYRENNKIFITIIFSIFALIILNTALPKMLNAEKGSINEALSIPYQQLARTYNLEKDEINNNDLKEIENFIPNVQLYNKYVSDSTKAQGTAWKNKIEFIKLYFKYLIKYPNRYIEAFVYNNMGYLFTDDTSNAKIYGEGFETRQGYLLTDTKDGFNVIHKSLFIKLENIYEILFSNNEYQNIPIISIIFSFSIYFWITLFCIFKNILNKNMYVVNLAIVILLCTILLGPCALIRYAFPYISVLPLLISMTYKKSL